jgi:hypothetical protein
MKNCARKRAEYTRTYAEEIYKCALIEIFGLITPVELKLYCSPGFAETPPDYSRSWIALSIPGGPGKTTLIVTG